MAIFTGSGVALVTPFHEDESINYDKLDELIDFHCNGGTDAIIICGPTVLSSAEQQVNPLLYQKKSTWNASNLRSSVSREESR